MELWQMKIIMYSSKQICPVLETSLGNGNGRATSLGNNNEFKFWKVTYGEEKDNWTWKDKY